MKKTSVVLSAVLFNLLTVVVINASSLVEYYGEYKNEHIILDITNRHASWLSRQNGKRVGGSSTRLIFKIRSNPGYKILNRTKVRFNRNSYIINGSNIENNYYTSGQTSQRGSFFPSFEFELEYYICKKSDEICIRVLKKFKVVINTRARGSHDRVKVEIVEITN